MLRGRRRAPPAPPMRVERAVGVAQQGRPRGVARVFDDLVTGRGGRGGGPRAPAARRGRGKTRRSARRGAGSCSSWPGPPRCSVIRAFRGRAVLVLYLPPREGESETWRRAQRLKGQPVRAGRRPPRSGALEKASTPTLHRPFRARRLTVKPCTIGSSPPPGIRALRTGASRGRQIARTGVR